MPKEQEWGSGVRAKSLNIVEQFWCPTIVQPCCTFCTAFAELSTIPVTGRELSRQLLGAAELALAQLSGRLVRNTMSGTFSLFSRNYAEFCDISRSAVKTWEVIVSVCASEMVGFHSMVVGWGGQLRRSCVDFARVHFAKVHFAKVHFATLDTRERERENDRMRDGGKQHWEHILPLGQ